MKGATGVATDNSFFQSLFNGLVKELQILGSLRTGVHWTPAIFASAQKEFVDSFLSQDIDWLRSVTKLPILIKGILTHEDATKAVEEGVDGIIMSNHGARQDDSLTTRQCQYLQLKRWSMLQVVRFQFFFNYGGVRRGTDIFKALALGAQAVLVGRPIIFGLAAKGENGVKSVLGMLKNELELTMAMDNSFFK